jgi:hypothetical protein
MAIIQLYELDKMQFTSWLRTPQMQAWWKRPQTCDGAGDGECSVNEDRVQSKGI